MPYLADFILSIVPATDHIPVHLISYIPGKTPISTWPTVIGMTVTYLVVIFGTRETMRDKSPLKLTILFRAHNFMLTTGSLVLFALLGEEVFSNWLKPEIGTYGSLCASEAYTNRMEFYLMLNYYLKYYELIDTVFLALKKKPLTFFHVYHHAATAILVFVQLNGRATVTWVAVFLNLGYLSLTYYYHYAAAGGAKVWVRIIYAIETTFGLPPATQWKRHLTTIQIAHYSLIIASATFASYHYAAYNWFPRYLPHNRGCAGTLTAGIVGTGIVGSYLLLAVYFRYQTYLPKAEMHGLAAWLWLTSKSTMVQAT